MSRDQSLVIALSSLQSTVRDNFSTCHSLCFVICARMGAKSDFSKVIEHDSVTCAKCTRKTKLAKQCFEAPNNVCNYSTVLFGAGANWDIQ